MVENVVGANSAGNSAAKEKTDAPFAPGWVWYVV
jgi:hypothetical protein